MKRRTLFKHLAIASAAAFVLPSCISDPKKVSIALNRLRITGEEEELLANLADVIIPATNTPGARATGAHLFTLVMVDDCLAKTEQERFLKGMRNFEADVRRVTGRSFSSGSPEERLAILATYEEKVETAGEDAKTFYSRTRDYIIQGYTSSQYFLTEVKPYQLVPGPNYRGCVSLSSEQKTLS